MISGLDLTQTVDYVLTNDKDNPTVWKLGIVPSYIFAKISNDAVNKEIETAYRLLQLSIKGWENFNIPYSTVKEKFFGREFEVVPIEVLEQIPLKVISELAMKALELNHLTDDERKN